MESWCSPQQMSALIMAAQRASIWHFLCEWTTLYPRGWLYEQVGWKIGICFLGSISGKRLARYLAWGVSYFLYNLLRVVFGWRWNEGECWEPFAQDHSLLISCREPVITIALLWFFTYNSSSLPIAKQLRWKPELKATSPAGWSAVYEIPCMRTPGRRKCITIWKDNRVGAEVERNKGD